MVVRQLVGLLAGNDQVKQLAVNAPFTREVVRRFIAGERAGDAVRVAGELAACGLRCTINYLGEDIQDPDQVRDVVDSYHRLVAALEEADLADRAEVSVKMGSIGLALGGDGAVGAAFDNATEICETLDRAGMTMTVDMEDHTTVDTTLDVVGRLRERFGWVGVALQADLRRTEDDCRRLAHVGSRVRLCKGAYRPCEGSYQSRQEIDLSFVRCLKILMGGEGHPMIATHDPRMVEIAQAVATRSDRERNSYEIQMLYGVRPGEQRRLAALGERVRVYVPYGTNWYPWLARRVAERPANLLLMATPRGQSG